jgi:hypothetical protein
VEQWVITSFVSILETISQIFTAGVSITAFALLLFSVTMNNRERIVRSFQFILICITIIFSADAFGSGATTLAQIELWTKLQWVGLILLPACYIYLSESLLFITGQISRRWRWLTRIGFFFGILFQITLLTNHLLGEIDIDAPPAPHFHLTTISEIFFVYYFIFLVLACINFLRAYQRTMVQTSKRRIGLLIFGAIGPVVATFPYLLFSSNFAAANEIIFWTMVIAVNILILVDLLIMAYAVSFFGIPWPDRVVKSRLFKWILRGPITVSVALGVMTIVRRSGAALGNPYSSFVPISMAVTVLLCEYLITILAPYTEKWLFYGRDVDDVALVKSVQDRLLTKTDLSQFLEMVLAGICDCLQKNGAYLVVISADNMELLMDPD